MPACLTPFLLKERFKDEMLVPCGRCPNCIKKRVSEWSFRLMQEAKNSDTAYFITLTYNNESVPITGNNFMSLDIRDTQKFFKKLRRSQFGSSGGNIKYYIVGEYGTETQRPHYHFVGFNIQLHHLVEKKDIRCIELLGYDSRRHIERSKWDKGYITIGTVGEDSVGYCLKYMFKKRIIPIHERDDRRKEFSAMSKGLGACYLTEEMKKWHLSDMLNRMYVNIEDGKKVSMCRYYKNRIYKEDERIQIGLHSRANMIKRQMDEYMSLTPSQRENFFNSQNDRVKHAFEMMYQDEHKNRISNLKNKEYENRKANYVR